MVIWADTVQILVLEDAAPTHQICTLTYNNIGQFQIQQICYKC